MSFSQKEMNDFLNSNLSYGDWMKKKIKEGVIREDYRVLDSINSVGWAPITMDEYLEYKFSTKASTSRL